MINLLNYTINFANIVNIFVESKYPENETSSKNFHEDSSNLRKILLIIARPSKVIHEPGISRLFLTNTTLRIILFIIYYYIYYLLYNLLLLYLILYNLLLYYYIYYNLYLA